ncbi:ornithine cyclodeaminase family protein [Streptomyces sp. URMC 127]|uniref:ornithine cyclodeaminase family protein n=1 Tax=Streptomyces sp. URMC 127 TaxID=3423402 RepID=UPI003F198551
METLILTQQHVAKLIGTCGRDRFMDLMTDRLQQAFAAAGTAGPAGSTPPRDGFLRGQGGTGVIEWMPYHRPGQAMTLKTVSYTPANPRTHGLPTINGSVTRFDDTTGRLTALCDGGLLTAVRTGAASAVASRLLALPGSRTLGVIGAGAQAVSQAHALSRVFPLERILVHDTDPGHAQSFSARVDFLGLDVRVTRPEEIEPLADIICTATSVGVGEGPVLPGTRLRPHVHINGVGADLVGKTELPAHVLTSAFVVPDHLAQARREGECQQLPASAIGPELPQLAAAPEQAAAHRDDVTVFDSTGFALEDHVALDVLLELAEAAGIGDRLLVEHLPSDALDPYSFVD